ncbi:hypothetical protein STEG23_016795 [Scotinomys teguina]
MAVSRGESEQNQSVLSGGHGRQRLGSEILKSCGTTTQKFVLVLCVCENVINHIPIPATCCHTSLPLWTLPFEP